MLDVQIQPQDFESRLQRAAGPLSRPFGGGVGRRARRELAAAQARTFDGVSGPPLSPRYAASKPAGAPLLVSSGRLRASLLGGEASELKVSDSEIVLGTRLDYAAPVQAGRPFLLDEAAAVETLEDVVGADLDQRVAAASGGLLEVE